MRCQSFLGSSLLLLTWIVSGCGSSPLVDPSGGASGQASIARRDSRQNAFPLETGRFLGFSRSSTAFVDPKIDYSLEVVGSAPQIGPGVMELVDPESRCFVLSDNKGVRIVALAGLQEATPRRLPRVTRLVTYPLRVGRIWEDRYGRGKKTVTVRYWIADRLMVRTPQGSYDVYQIERRVWQGPTRPDYSSDGLGRWTYYYAPGVGPVQIGTRWPGVTTQTYQLCTTSALGFARADVATVGTPWRGLAAGLESLAGR
jgi:hypothetical protein